MVIVRDTNKKQFLEFVKGKKLIIYGAGYCCQESIEMLNLYDYVYAICDSNTEKVGKEYDVGNRCVVISDINNLLQGKKLDENEYVILVTTTIYSYEVMKKLDDISSLDGINVFFYGLIRSNFDKNQIVTYEEGKKQIPSKIHYCWFGGKPIPDEMKRYMDSWLDMNPEFELILHDESNYNIQKNPYMYQAYKSKAWGFVPDFARLDIIYNEGGIYLDTDVQLVKPLEPLMRDEAFFGFCNDIYINLGNGFGAIPHHPLIKKMLDCYKEVSFINDDGTLNRKPCQYYQTPIFKQVGFDATQNEMQRINGIAVYPNSVLSPYGNNDLDGFNNIGANTIGIHYSSTTWLTKDEKERKRNLMEIRQRAR